MHYEPMHVELHPLLNGTDCISFMKAMQEPRTADKQTCIFIAQ